MYSSDGKNPHVVAFQLYHYNMLYVWLLLKMPKKLQFFSFNVKCQHPFF